MEKNISRTFPFYILSFLILGIIFFLYLFFKNMPPNFPLMPEQREISVYDFSRQLNNANNFYKSQRYEMAIKILNKIANSDLKPKQKYSIAMLKACCYKSLGLYNTSLEQIEKALSFYEHPFAYYLRGLIYTKQKIKDKAIKMYQQCIKMDPFYYYAYERLGDLYLYQRDYRQSVDYYNCQDTIKSHLPEVLHLKKIAALYLMNDNTAAVQDLEQYFALSKDKKHLETAYFLKAIIADSLGYKETAEDSFLNLMQLADRKQDGLANYYYALHLVKNKSYDAAAKKLEPYIQKYELENRRIYFTLGQICYLRGEYAKSYQYFYKNIQVNKNREDLYYLATSAYKIGKLKTALKYFDELLKDKPIDEYSLSAYITMAYCYADLSRPQDSIRLFNVALEDFGENEPLIMALGEMTLRNVPDQFNRIMSRYMVGGRYPKLNLLLVDHYLSNQEFRSALELVLEYMQKEQPITESSIHENSLSKKYAELNKICGDIYLRQREKQKAKMYYQKGLVITDDTQLKISILNNLGYYYFSQNNIEQTKKLLQSALELKNSPAINLNLSLINQNDPLAARRFLLAAVNGIDEAQHELKAAIYFELAMWYSRENPEKARSYFKEVLKWNDKHQLAKYYLNKA